MLRIISMKHQAPKGGEVSMTEKQTGNGGGEARVTIPSESHDPKGKGVIESLTPRVSNVDSPVIVHNDNDAASGYVTSKSSPLNCASPEIRFSPSPNMPRTVPTPNANFFRRVSLARSRYSKPKSRFGEQFYHIDEARLEENITSTMQEQLSFNSPHRTSKRRVPISPEALYPIHESASEQNSSPALPLKRVGNSSNRNPCNASSSNNKSGDLIRNASVTLQMPLMSSPGPAGEDGDEDAIIDRKVELGKGKRKSLITVGCIKWILLVCNVGILVASLTLNKLKSKPTWGLGIWRWCVLVMVTFWGMLVTKWLLHILVFFIEKTCLLRKNVFYFVHGLKKHVQVLIWLGSALLTWVLLINRGAPRSKLATKIFDGVTRTLLSLVIGAFLFLLKTLLLKILASIFHVKSFFDRLRELIFHQYILQTLSGPPLLELTNKVERSSFSFRSTKGKSGTKEDVIDMEKLHKLKKEKVSAWNMKILINAVKNSRLPTISNFLDESSVDREAIVSAAYHIFDNVAAAPGCTYIEEEKLRKFMIEEEVFWVFPLLAQAETGQITRKSLANWVLTVYHERKALAHALRDTKTAIKQLSKLLTWILVVVTIIVWVMLMEIATTTTVLVFFSSQLIAASFIFGNTCKDIFEAIIFVFVKHPFDVGDRCAIGGVELLVEEMNLLTTVFLKPNNETVYYPNSVLATMVISNYNRSPSMGDVVEFTIDFNAPPGNVRAALPAEDVREALKESIKRYLERNPQYWHPNHNLVIKEIENVNKLKMSLYVTHTMNFQEVEEKNKRRTELIMELHRISEGLGIRYNLFPQGVAYQPY